VVIGIILMVGIPFVYGLNFIRDLTTGSCSGDGDPAAYDLPFEEVSFQSSEFNMPIRAYFIPGDNGATLIVPPGTTGGRGGWLHEIAVLNRNGYSALSYESRNCMGHPISLGYAEVTEVGDALDYLATRPDVNMEKVGVHGFSAAGAMAIMAGARYPAISAVLAEGGYHDFGESLHDTVQAQGWSFLGAFYELGARFGYRYTTGYDVSVLSPVSVIGQIAPRPILLIYGTNEPSLPGAHLELAAAGDNAELWEVTGATHGSYWYTAPEEFEERVIAFYDRAFDISR
jgi:uncharacterized protein